MNNNNSNLITIERKLRDIVIELFKLKQTILLMLSGIFSYIIAAGVNGDIKTILFLTISLYLSVSGTTGLNMYLDRDIDSIMFRTMMRPLPQRRISEKEAFTYSVPLILLGLIIALYIDTWVFIADFIGIVVDIFLYTYLLKRRTVFNIVLGSIAGGMPAFGGWCAYAGSPQIGGALISLIIALWAMLHIWYISTYFYEDYKKAKIPMLPVVYGFKFSGEVSIIVTIFIYSAIIALGYLRIAGSLTFIVSTIITALLLFYEAKFVAKDDKKLARKIYKYLNMYLGLILLIMTIEALLAY